MGVHY